MPVRSAHRLARRALAAPALVLVVCSSWPPAAHGGEVRYAPPVAAAVVDGFRPPPGPYAAGNRGLEYRTVPGSPAHAVAAGTVAFAGPVAGRLVVSVVHPDGLRSSLTGLATVQVAAGGTVGRGEVLGTTTGVLHLGIRRGDTYLDPAALFALDAAAVRLVPAEGPLGGTPPSSGTAPLGPVVRAVTRVGCPPACKGGGG